MASTESPLICKSLPLTANDDVKFNEPWEARAFAIVVPDFTSARTMSSLVQ